jgi:excisionase family DNA binding protein
MNVASRLRQLAELLPPDGAVTLSRGDLLRLVDDAADAAADASGSLTVEELAERLRRSRSTVRGWLADGRFPGAYKRGRREWRVPADDVAAFEAEEAERYRAGQQREARSGTGGPADTSTWRQHLPPA